MDKAHTAYLTIYYEKSNSLEEVLDQIIESVHPNFKILIGLNFFSDYIELYQFF